MTRSLRQAQNVQVTFIPWLPAHLFQINLKLMIHQPTDLSKKDTLFLVGSIKQSHTRRAQALHESVGAADNLQVVVVVVGGALLVFLSQSVVIWLP